MREGKPPPGAFSTAVHGPGRRRAATGAKRLLDASQRRSAAAADLRPWEKADEATLRQEQIEHVTTLGRAV